MPLFELPSSYTLSETVLMSWHCPLLKGQGSNFGWYYYDDSGAKQFSKGTEMTMPVYRAGQQMIKDFDSIVKEVFGN